MNNNTQPVKVVSGGSVEASNSMWPFVLAAVVAGLILGFFFGSYWQAHKKLAVDNSQTMSDDQSASQDVTESTGNMSPTVSPAVTNLPNENSVQVVDQGASTLVHVDSVSLKDPAWIAVREDNAGGLGKILGAQRVDAGTQTNVVISLLRPTEVGKMYHIVLYRDDGTKVFNYSAAGFIPGVSQTFTAFAAR